VLLCPPAGRVPYEMLIAGGGDGAPFASDGLDRAFGLLRSAIRRLRAVEGPVPWNAWLHNGPAWHIEIVPRLTVFAGIELGAGIYVNTLPPEQAAAALRGVGR
jgi:UDPglucose--hexose-1-phosphate uridylyltransferase